MNVSDIRSLMNSHRGQVIDQQHSSFAAVLEVVRGRASWAKHLNRIKKFRIDHRLALFVKVAPGKWWRASWNPNSQKSQVSYQLQSALRYAVSCQIIEWKRIHWSGRRCACCASTTRLQADHKARSFYSLTRDFLKQDPEPPPVHFDYHRLGREFKTENKLFEHRWQLFHRVHGELQWLCQRCNIQKGRRDDVAKESDDSSETSSRLGVV